MNRLQIIDTTLREGEQTPGVLFSIAQKKQIIDGLAAVGVDEVELGIVSRYNRCAPELLAHCRKNYPVLRTSLWCRCRREDIMAGVALGPDLLSLSIPVSDIHLHERLDRDRDWAINQMKAAIAQTQKAGLACSIGFEDATRADRRFLLQMAEIASTMGVVRIRLADTVGVASPIDILELVGAIQDVSTCAIGLHTHNDFGMATANGISGYKAGAQTVDTSVLGLGERTGCARLEEIVAWLALREDHQHLHPEALRSLALSVAELADRPIPVARPIVGDAIFHCETGLHLQGLLNNTSAYEPFSPEKIGARRQLLFGAKTGLHSLRNHLHNLQCNTEISNNTVQKVRETALRLGRALTDHELKSLCMEE